ncbi:efflux RND transporter periplasmic adaptor subunit [Pedobacter sp. MC2016-24]|uniref:efflux RND transporter periplasmic adaptor subunit n=1 Tax=Pedobacter sp. MC2016-24 TaxID=2780090 RepID=UPI0018827991|nr:efflux RND transporter periplasmic adaptor subunit [Pedobacter sp. MC2016-24]MBE9601542.1 efflux RND transporter periplasmic adaptor subunit [Pedobacter sp. MC2016-24]
MEYRKTKNNIRNLRLLILITTFFYACSNQKNEKQNENTITVNTETVSLKSESTAINVSGNIEGNTTVKLGYMVPGKINLINFKAGQLVTKGQLITSLDATSYALSKQLADVQLMEANDEFKRLKLMHERGSVSESDFKKAGFSLQRAQTQQKIELKSFMDTKLYSPIDGILLTKQTEVGEIISPGTPLFVVSAIKKVTMEAFIPEGELNGLYIGQSADVIVSALRKTFKGKITEIGAVADATSRAFTIKIEIKNNDLIIRPGMIAEAQISTGSKKNIIQLASECIMHDVGNQSYVYVADKNGRKAFRRNVGIGKITQNKIEILTGLSIGETVITSGQTKLSDGSLISIVK